MTDSKLIKTLKIGLSDAKLERGFALDTAKLYYGELAHAIGDVKTLFVPSQARPDKISRVRELTGQLDGMCGAGSGGAVFAEMCALLCGDNMPTLSAMANGTEEEIAAHGDAIQVAYVTGSAADNAYGLFERAGWSRTHTDRVQNACNSVMCGDTDYTIVPIKNSADGRLCTFYRTIAEFDLKIVDTVTVRASSVSTTYALCAASFGELEDPDFMEFSSKTDGKGASRIIEAIETLGHRTEEITSFPDPGGKTVYQFVVSIGGDVRAALLYLDLFHPDHRITGIYGTCGGEDDE